MRVLPWLAGVGALAALGVAAYLWIGHAEPLPLEIPPEPVPVVENAEIDEAALRPGLQAIYQSLADESARVARIDLKPNFTWGNSSPHPLLPPKSWQATWSGVLLVREKDSITFSSQLSGTVTVVVDGKTVLSGTDDDQVATPLPTTPGAYRLQIDFQRDAKRPGRLQLWWEGQSFAKEPLPATRLKHLPSELDPSVREEEAIERGRSVAANFGCAHCHRGAMPTIDDPPPGPSLANLKGRFQRDWLLDWLAEPARLRQGAHMPMLFDAGRGGFVERWLIADYLQQGTPRATASSVGDHRLGRQYFMGLGCFACHPPPDGTDKNADDPQRHPYRGLGDRYTLDQLAAHIVDPTVRYPDGRMPKVPVPAKEARDIAAFLLLWSKPTASVAAASTPTAEEIAGVAGRLRVVPQDVGKALVRDKGCVHCHVGLEDSKPADIPLRSLAAGCLGGTTLPHFTLNEQQRSDLMKFLSRAARERYASPVVERQHLLERASCLRCHQRDRDEAAPLVEIGRVSWSPFLARMPYQRTPSLTGATTKYTRKYLLQSLRDGVSGVRPKWYSFHMPTFGSRAEQLVQALAEGDGDSVKWSETPAAVASNAELARPGPTLVGHEGYSCVTCHVFHGSDPQSVEPGTVGPELTSVTERVQRPWFDRWLEDPGRVHPGTPMPAVFPRGRPPGQATVLGGDPTKQKDALWAYFALGREAPMPSAKPPMTIDTPSSGPPLIAQIPVHLPDKSLVEAIVVLFPSHDLLLYDVGQHRLQQVFTGARLLRTDANFRGFIVEGTPGALPKIDVALADGRELLFLGYEQLADGLRVRTRWITAKGPTLATDDYRIVGDGSERQLTHEARSVSTTAKKYPLPARQAARVTTPAVVPTPPSATGEDTPARPGYRLVRYPRPKTTTGEDRVMPAALAVHPRDGRLFVASMKLGELFVLHDPHGDGRDARFDSHLGGPVQDCFGLHAEDKALYVLHRRNLTRVLLDGTKPATRFDRVALIQHGVADTYDWGYGLVREKSGSLLLSLAPHANRQQAGSGSVLRVTPGINEVARSEEIAFGLRNPFGWCVGPGGATFFTDNQGEWVASNKLCHLSEGRFFGFPNPEKPQHGKLPHAPTAVWVPYGWARSLNGVAYDNSGGKFGPFAGQFFIAELMHGGGIIRANVEEVNGVWQGACFPFWGQGLLGPLCLAFDPHGRLYVGSITQPGWIGQPDRGAVYRIDYSGELPFEIQNITIRPQGFRLRFTKPIDRSSATSASSYLVEHYRYEYTGAYGSPELDRTRLTVGQIDVATDGMSVDLTLPELQKGRIYSITAKGLRSSTGEVLLHATGVYTVNEVPKR
jgi:mono/diheme cytochrome c family protein/glucose/arabinose dehydrogenase